MIAQRPAGSLPGSQQRENWRQKRDWSERFAQSLWFCGDELRCFRHFSGTQYFSFSLDPIVKFESIRPVHKFRKPGDGLCLPPQRVLQEIVWLLDPYRVSLELLSSVLSRSTNELLREGSRSILKSLRRQFRLEWNDLKTLAFCPSTPQCGCSCKLQNRSGWQVGGRRQCRSRPIKCPLRAGRR